MKSLVILCFQILKKTLELVQFLQTLFHVIQLYFQLFNLVLAALRVKDDFSILLNMHVHLLFSLLPHSIYLDFQLPTLIHKVVKLQLHSDDLLRHDLLVDFELVIVLLLSEVLLLKLLYSRFHSLMVRCILLSSIEQQTQCRAALMNLVPILYRLQDTCVFLFILSRLSQVLLELV